MLSQRASRHGAKYTHGDYVTVYSENLKRMLCSLLSATPQKRSEYAFVQIVMDGQDAIVDADKMTGQRGGCLRHGTGASCPMLLIFDKPTKNRGFFDHDRRRAARMEDGKASKVLPGISDTVFCAACR